MLAHREPDLGRDTLAGFCSPECERGTDIIGPSDSRARRHLGDGVREGK